MTAPTLEAVPAAFRPGRVVGLDLTREQKRELRDAEGQIALDVLRHPLGARAAVGAPERFPLTERAIQAFTRKLGHKVGQPLPWATEAARGGGSHPRIGQLPPALQGLRRSLGLLRAPVQNPARDVLPQHRQASCRQSLRRQARTRASMVAAPPVRGLLGAPAARDYALTGAADGHSGRGIRDAWLAAARAPYPRTLVFGRLRSVTGSGGTVGEVERWHLLHRGQRDA